jgi:hypothetical protein
METVLLARMALRILIESSENKCAIFTLHCERYDKGFLIFDYLFGERVSALLTNVVDM